VVIGQIIIFFFCVNFHQKANKKKVHVNRKGGKISKNLSCVIKCNKVVWFCSHLWLPPLPLGCHLHHRWFVMEGLDPTLENKGIVLTQPSFSCIRHLSFFAICWVCHLHLTIFFSSSPLAIALGFCKWLLKMHNVWNQNFGLIARD